MKDGMVAKGKDLSCEDFYITVGGAKVSRTEFTYGEKFDVQFENMEGFVQGADKIIYPGMEITVLDSKGKKVLYNKDLYANFPEPIVGQPANLSANMKIGDPMDVGNHTLKLHMWDKKGKGTFDLEFKFKVSDNKQIQATHSGINFDKIYLYDQKGDSAITKNNIQSNQRVYVIIEGLRGFKTENDLCSVGLEMKAVDKQNNIVFEEKDLLGDQGINPKDLTSQVYANFMFGRVESTTPVTIKLRVYDKLGEGEIKADIHAKVVN
jgi:hypothetical protein